MAGMARVALVVAVAACSAKGPPAGESAAGTRPAASPATAAFWTWFAAHAAELAADAKLEHAMSQINDHLQPDHAGIYAEVGVDGAQRVLVLTADGNKQRFAAVREVYATRPTVAGWNVVAFRQRDPSGNAIEIGGARLDPKTMKFISAKDGEQLSVIVFVPGFQEDMKPGLYLVLDHTVGEYDMETRIGGLDIRPIDKAPASAQPLLALPGLIDATFRK